MAATRTTYKTYYQFDLGILNESHIHMAHLFIAAFLKDHVDLELDLDIRYQLQYDTISQDHGSLKVYVRFLDKQDEALYNLYSNQGIRVELSDRMIHRMYRFDEDGDVFLQQQGLL